MYIKGKTDTKKKKKSSQGNQRVGWMHMLHQSNATAAIAAAAAAERRVAEQLNAFTRFFDVGQLLQQVQMDNLAEIRAAKLVKTKSTHLYESSTRVGTARIWQTMILACSIRSNSCSSNMAGDNFCEKQLNYGFCLQNSAYCSIVAVTMRRRANVTS